MPIYMKLDGIEGITRPGHYAGWHEVKSFSWGLSNVGGSQVGDGSFGDMGKINIGDASFTKVSDKTSSMFQQFCTLGSHIANAEINFTAGTQQDKKYAVVKFQDVLITSYQISCGDNDFPIESFSLSFSGFETEFAKLDSKTGKVDAGAKFKYDIKAAKA